MPDNTSPSEQEDVPTAYIIRFTQRAVRDIDEVIADLLTSTTDTIAVEWRDGLFRDIATLRAFPLRRPVAPESRRFKHTVRQLPYRRPGSSFSHRILFSVSDEGEDAATVLILHVRHGARRPITAAEAREIEAQAD